MKFKNCFIGKDGDIWKEKTLIEASKDLPVIQFDVNSIPLDEEIRWNTDNLRDYITHYSRVTKADLTIPIILRSDGYPMDGWHRIIKARFEGLQYLPARKFKTNPEPDFKS